MEPPVILCLDLATSTGAALGRVGSKPTLETWDLRKAGMSRGERYRWLWNELRLMFRHVPAIQHVYYEAPLRLAAMMHVGTSEETISFLRGLVAVTELACAEHEIPCDTWDVQKARASVCGQSTFPKVKTLKGKSRGTAKDRVLQVMHTLGHVVMNDNEADAVVGFLYVSALLNPRLAHLTTPLFRTHTHAKSAADGEPTDTESTN